MLVVNCADLVFVRLPVGTTVWDRALQRLSDAVEGIESRISVSAACQKDLDALSAAGGPGLSLAGIQDKLATVDLQNGPRSNAPLAVLLRDPMNLAETQHKRCSFFAPFLPKRDQIRTNQSHSDLWLFARKFIVVHAIAQQSECFQSVDFRAFLTLKSGAPRGA